MNGIKEIENDVPSKRAYGAHARKHVWRSAIAAASLLILVGVLTLVGLFGKKEQSQSFSIFSVLAQATEAISQLQTLHMKYQVRTIPHDNFELVRVDYDFVPHEIWKVFSDPPLWRVEKPGRIVVMDGDSCLLWIRKGVAAKLPPQAGVVQWMKRLLNPDQLFDYELTQARAEKSSVTITTQTDANGREELVMTVEAEPLGDFSENDFLLNKSISESHNVRIYYFDPQSLQLNGLEVYVRIDGVETLVFEIQEIEYNGEIDPSVFTLEIPEDVIWANVQPEALPNNEYYQNMTPEEAVRALFQACADEDWDEAVKFLPFTSVHEKLKEYLGGLEIIEIGEPFQSGSYVGYFVPYEILLRYGETKKNNLAIRNDNPAKRWILDGGL